MKTCRFILVVLLFLVVTVSVFSQDFSLDEGPSGLIVTGLVVIGLAVLNMLGMKEGFIARMLRNVRPMLMSPANINAEVNRLVRKGFPPAVADLAGDLAEFLVSRLPALEPRARARALIQEVSYAIVEDVTSATPEDASALLGGAKARAVATPQNRARLTSAILTSPVVATRLAAIAEGVVKKQPLDWPIE